MSQTQLNHLYWAHEREHYRNDLRIGHLQALIANLKTDPKKRKRPYEALDFVCVPDPDKEGVRNKKMARAVSEFTKIIKNTKCQ
jgi:hypothetical protein